MSPKAKTPKTSRTSKTSTNKKPAAGRKAATAGRKTKASKAKPKAAAKKKATPRKKSAAKSKVAVKKVTKKKTVAVKSKSAKKKKVAGARKAKAAKRLPRLTPKQIEHYHELLTTKQRKLTAASHISKGDSRSDLDDGTEDYIDYAVHSYAREFLLSLTELERKQLYLVEEAVERLKRRQFGYCQHCRKTINTKRLEVAPWARYCIPCQELDEQGLLDARLDVDDEVDGQGPAEDGDPAGEDDIGSDEHDDDDEGLVAGRDG